MNSTAQTAALTAVAMVAFAANSLLCRAALGAGLIDPGSFALLRTLSGALTLGAILLARGNLNAVCSGHWRTAAMLFTYMIFFTFAYTTLSAGTGALILFGAVQLTMFATALRSETFSRMSWFGLALAVAGLVYLVSPGITAPDPLGAILMAIAGIAWGAYSLLGRTVGDPLTATAGAFIVATPAVLGVAAIAAFFSGFHMVLPSGAVLAIASGALASGCGYVIWYAALRGLTGTRAATVQLSVPVIAAIGGIIFLAEDVTLRLVVASLATLGGVAIVLAQRTAKKA